MRPSLLVDSYLCRFSEFVVSCELCYDDELGSGVGQCELNSDIG